MRILTLSAALIAAIISTAAIGQTSDEPPKPSSRAAQLAECGIQGTKPSWCNEVEDENPNRPNLVSKGWTVRLLSDEMDVDKHATITGDLYSAGRNVGSFTIDVWNGGRIVTHSAFRARPFGFDNRYWPYCRQNLDTISVDGGSAMYLAGIERGGWCDQIAHNGRVISAMKLGGKAKIRMHHGEFSEDDFEIDLSGFTAAYNRAVQLTRR